MEALKVTGLNRRYGSREVLKNFALTVEAGSFEALMGPSGSGKSTLLHLAAGLLSPDSGEILVGGRDVAKMSDAEAAKFRRRHVGVVFQAFNLLADRSVRENILLPLKLDRAPVNEARFDSLVGLLGLEGLVNSKCERLSGGEQQRVAIARALVAEPDIVLADEPTGNLDSRSTRAICSLLGEVNKSEKSALLVVTHDPVVAASAGKVHFLMDGAIVSTRETCGDPELVSRLYLECCK